MATDMRIRLSFVLVSRFVHTGRSRFCLEDIFSFNSLLEGWALVGDSDQANRIYDSIQSGKDMMRPNIVTFTSAMKANRADLSRVQTIVEECVCSLPLRISDRHHWSRHEARRTVTLD